MSDSDKLTLLDVLLTNTASINLEDKWLCVEKECDIKLNRYIVYQRKYYAKKTRVLYEGYNEHLACITLIEG